MNTQCRPSAIGSPRIWILALATMSLVCMGLVSRLDAATTPQEGDWTIRPASQSGEVRFALMPSTVKGSSRHESTVSVSIFEGLNPSLPGKQAVAFALVREAGRFDFEGYLTDGKGAGTFRFSPDARFANSLEALGFEVDSKTHFWLAVQDVTTEFAREMQGAGLQNLDVDMLLAFRIHGVSSAYLESLRATGQRIEDSDTLVAFRIHGVTPDEIRAVRQAGFSPDNDTLLAMRIHGATPEWIEQVTQQGIDTIDLDSLIAFRIHGVSPEFIDELHSLGYSDLDAHDLIAFRIHGVNPEEIRELRDEGLDLDADELIAARIHGVSPEFVQQARAGGATDLDFESLLQLKILGR